MKGRSKEDAQADRNGMPMAKEQDGLPKHEGGKFEDSMKHEQPGHKKGEGDGKASKKKGGKHHSRHSSRK